MPSPYKKIFLVSKVGWCWIENAENVHNFLRFLSCCFGLFIILVDLGAQGSSKIRRVRKVNNSIGDRKWIKLRIKSDMWYPEMKIAFQHFALLLLCYRNEKCGIAPVTGTTVIMHLLDRFPSFTISMLLSLQPNISIEFRMNEWSHNLNETVLVIELLSSSENTKRKESIHREREFGRLRNEEIECTNT